MTKRTLPPLFGRALALALCLLFLFPVVHAQAGQFRFGVNADNWKGEISRPGFVQALKSMGVEFVVWHVSPEELATGRIMDIVLFCRANKLSYLFNTELMNYVPNVPQFTNRDGTYRWDLNQETLERFKDDPLFLGQVYDEPMLMQSLNGAVVAGKKIPPYFADTSAMQPEQAHAAVVEKIKEIHARLARYGKRAVFEMVFPDYAHAAAQGGAVLAPKLLKETPNDLMFPVYAGAARQYAHKELWACVDLWFLDRFPEKGKNGPGFQTPENLYEALCYAYSQGFDWAYIEHLKGLVDLDTGALTAYGRKVQEFQAARAQLPRTSWQEFTPQLVVKRFPDGSWGQRYSAFIPDHPYGSHQASPALREASARWLQLLSAESSGKLPPDANNWNATNHPYFQKTPYFLLAGLPPMLVVDHTFTQFDLFPQARVVDLTQPKKE